MIKYIIYSLSIFYSQYLFPAETKEVSNSAVVKREQLILLVNDEIQTITNNNYSGPELKHRLFELYTEKIKLTKENENLLLLKSDGDAILKNGKDSYFKNSLNQYFQAQDYALAIIKKYPQYNRISEIYYALAINSRDYGSGLETEKFLKLSISNSTDNSKTMYNAKTALAEFYYNNKRYNDAISYYLEVLKNKNDEWYGKHLYNASWCYLKERKFKKAIDLIKESFETSKNTKYVSMRDQINNAIGIFYVQADLTHEGIEFYEKNTAPASPWLLSLANSSMNKNNFSITEDVLRAALKDTKRRKDPGLEMKVRMTQLDIYRESKKEELFFETANSILEIHKKYKISIEDKELSIRKIKDVAGFMQINLVKDKNKEFITYKKDDYTKIIRFFDILSSLDAVNKNQYRYYQGETALSIHDYKTAIAFYVKAIMNSKIIKDKGEFAKKSIDAMLSTIELAKFKKQQEDEFTIFALKNYVLLYPQSEKSQAIYQKLFSKYFELHKTKKSLNIMLVYKLNYKNDIKIHREMLTQILEIYIKEKSTDKLAYWVSKIEKGYLEFDALYIQNSIAILGGLLFDKYQGMEKIGQYKEAMNGYESIYDSKQYPNRIKAEAAYAISTLYQLQNKAANSYKWLNKSLDIYDNKDLIKITPSLLVLAKGYRLLQNISLSSKLAKQVTTRFCNDEFEVKNEFYELILTNSAIENPESNNLIRLEEEYKSCNLKNKFIEKTQIDNFERLISNGDTKEITAYFEAHHQNEKLSRQMGRYLKFKFWQSTEDQKNILEIHYKTLNAATPTLALEAMLTQYGRVKEFRSKISRLKFQFTILPKFDEVKYNLEMEQYFSIIADLFKEAVTLSKDSTPEEVLLIREVLSEPYNSLVDSINAFVPRGVESKYLVGFKIGMRQITESLLAKSLQVDREKMAYLEKNNFFFEIQKHDKFNDNKDNLKSRNRLYNILNVHSALIFSNTMDLNRGQK